jgi:hypothetical protein
MAEKIEKLHTAIRHYCIENYQFWAEKYSQIDETRSSNNNYTDEAYSIFPRYNVLDAILTEIEKFQPKDFGDFEEARDFFCLISKQAESIFTKPPNNEIVEKTQNEEREKLCNYIIQLTTADLEKIEPLFYRRVLSKTENEDFREKLKEHWNVNGYWFPLAQEKPKNAEAFIATHFQKDFELEKFRLILAEIGTEKVFEISESDINYEMEISVFEPIYCGSECFWFDEKFEWLIYASHENSITFAGSILPKIKSHWANWEENLWVNWELS